MKAMQTKLIEQIDFEDELERTEGIQNEIEFYELYEERIPSTTQAYMLVYIRERDMDRILSVPKATEIP